MPTMNEWAREIYEWAWEEERNFGELIALLHSEASEVLESWRNNEPPSFVKDGKPEGWGVELADIIIRVLNVARHYDLNMDHLIRIKMLHNETRDYRHGGKRA